MTTDRDDIAPGLDDLLSEVQEALDFDWDDDHRAPEDADEGLPVLRFGVGGDAFALEASYLREVLGKVPITRLPGAPPHIEGITVLRRQVVGLINLRRFLGLEAAPAAGEASTTRTEAERVLVVSTDLYTVGFLVDTVAGLDTWPSDALARRELPDSLGRRLRRYARSVHTMGSDIVALLDLERLLEEAAVR